MAAAVAEIDSLVSMLGLPVMAVTVGAVMFGALWLVHDGYGR